MNVRYLEESRGVTAIQWIPRSPPCPFHLGDPEVNFPPRPLPFPLLSSHSGSVHGTFLGLKHTKRVFKNWQLANALFPMVRLALRVRLFSATRCVFLAFFRCA